MPPMRHLTIAALGLATLTSAATARQLPELNASNADHWKRKIMPNQDDLAFEAIPWLSSLEAGLRAADAQQKPLLLWVMNGHPLGCT